MADPTIISHNSIRNRYHFVAIRPSIEKRYYLLKVLYDNVYHLLASESIFVSFFTLEELLSFSVNVVVDVADDDDGLEMHEETVKQHDDILTRETHDQEINVRNLLLHLLLKVLLLLLKCHFSSFCSLRLAKTSRKMAHILRAALLLLIAASTTYRVVVLLPFLMTFRFIST